MNEKQLVINTMDEAKYRELSRKGRIRGDELNIVDDDSKNRTTIPSYDLFEMKTESLQTQITDTNVNNLELSYNAETRKIQLSGKDAVITELNAAPFVSDNFLSAAEYRNGTLVLYVVQDSGKTNEISVAFPVDAELNPESSNPIQNKTVYAEFQNKLNKSDESVVKYVPHTSDPNRKIVVLKNHDEIIGTRTDGAMVNLAMVSKWDVADFGSNAVHLNLNSKDAVTINDSLSVLTNEDKTEIKNELQNKTNKTDFETAKDDLNGRVDDLDTKTSDRERELADEIASVSSKMPELQDAIDSEVGRAKSVERELGDKVESIQNEKADKTTLDSYYTKDEADGKFLTEHQDISGKADKAEVEEALAGKIDKTDESIVRFQPNEQTAGRKKISLNNYDNIVGKAIDGTEYNLAMISKWDVADFGSTGVHLNLNTKDAVTINDKFQILTTANDIYIKNLVETECQKRVIRNEFYRVIVAGNMIDFRIMNGEASLTETTGFISWIRHIITAGEAAESKNNKITVTMTCDNTAVAFNDAGMDGEQSIVAKQMTMFFSTITHILDPKQIKLADLIGKPIDITVKHNEFGTEVKYSVFVEG